MKENRTSPRYLYIGEIELEYGGETIRCETVNLAENGMCIISPVVLLKGSKGRISFRIELDEETFDSLVAYRVVWVEPTHKKPSSHTVGLEFTDKSDAINKNLRALLKYLSAT
jgi:hypothetical protein